jgi:hypothetical protein
MNPARTKSFAVVVTARIVQLAARARFSTRIAERETLDMVAPHA